MGFGSDLQGQTSHEAMLRLQEVEIRHLESIRKCINHRINVDKNYANELKTFVGLAQKFQNGGFTTPMFEAWTIVIKETEKLSQIIEDQANRLCRTTLDRLCFLIGEKKNAKKLYDDERSRIDRDIRVLQGRVKHSHTEYEKLMIKVQEDSTRYHEQLHKKKVSSKLDEARSRYHRNSMKLHKVHNDYVMVLRHAGLLQEEYRHTLLPGLLDFQQKVQETFSQQSKEVLQEYASLTDVTSVQYANCFKNIHHTIGLLQPKEEYTMFIENNKTSPYAPLEYTFDERLLDNYNGNLKANQIALNDLTVESLTHGRSQFEEKLSSLKQKIENKKKDLESKEDEIAHIPAKDDMDNSHKKSLTSKKCDTYQLMKDMAEFNARLRNYKTLYDLVNTPLLQLGDDDPPTALDLDQGVDESLLNCSEKYDDQSIGSTPERRYSTFGEKMKEGFQKLRTRISSTNLAAAASSPSKPPSVVDLQNHKSASGSTEMLASPSSYQEVPAPFKRALPPVVSTKVSTNPPSSPTRKLEEEEWFHGVLPREEVQRLLINEGDYLVRESKQRQTGVTQYVLSVKWSGYKHFIVQGSEGAWRFEGPSFSTIQELVSHQEQSNMPVTNKSQTILGKAVCREKWEILNDDVQLQVKIGGGNFGDVYKGTYKNREVAVKTCKENLTEDQKKKFLQEGRILKQYDHPNIVKFIGIAAHRQPVMIVMEYAPGGSLHKFLQMEGYKQPVKTLIKMCEDAAAGMAYLEKANCIHRDLAARNCLIGSNSVVKISDFGMSREDEIYIVSDGLKQIPIKWTAPEALNLGTYTSLSDVWSFGILMWEVFSLGANPYSGLSNQQARDRIEQGYRMPKPDKVDTPEQIYDVMLRCWQYDPEHRSRFDRIYRELQRIRNIL